VGERAGPRPFRSPEGRVRLLKNYGVHALEKEPGRRATHSALLVLGIFLVFTLGFLFFSKGTLVGFFFLQDGNIVTFPLEESWNLSEGLIRIEQNSTLYDVYDLLTLVNESTISVDLDNYALDDGYVSVALLLNETVVDSAYVYYEKTEEIVAEDNATVDTPAPEETVTTLSEETAETLTAYSGFFQSNSTGTYQIDYVIVEPKIPYINNTLNCSNGSISPDVSSLLYVWYVNKSLLRNDNRSTLGPGNFTVKDRVDCGIVPQNASNLIAYWPFDEGAGTEFHEIVSNNSGSSNFSDWKLGRRYYAVNISRFNNYTVGSPIGLNVTKNFTWEFWFYSTQSITQEILNFDTWRIFISSDKINVHFPLGENGSSERLVSNASIPTDAWTQVVVTYDNTTLAVYINGTLDNSTSLSGRIGNYSGSIFFGKNATVGTTFFKGLFDEVALYNSSLTASEIYDHYTKGIARLSQQHTLEVDTNQEHFGNGTCVNVNCTIQPGNITLANSSGSAYNLRGNFTSRILELPNGHADSRVGWTNRTVPLTNITLRVRTGVRSDNDTIVFSDYFGPDPVHSRDPSIVLGFDFSEGRGNTSLGITDKIADMTNNDFTAQGKHGTAARLYGINVITTPSFGALALTRNFTIELWVRPAATGSMALLSRQFYSLYTNASGNVIFNSTMTGNTSSLASMSTLPAFNWTHIAVTRDADNTTRLFINGSLEATLVHNGTTNISTNSLQIGGSGLVDPFNGTIDSLVIYSRNLSTEEIQAHALDVFANASGADSAGDLNRFLQYRAFFSTSLSSLTPTLLDVSLRVLNYSTFISNHNPANTSLVAPANGTIITSASIQVNWTRAADLENDTVFYEFMLANDSNFSQVLVSTVAVNNISQVDYADDNQTIFVEHFESKETMLEHDLRGNWTNSLASGRFGNGFEAKTDGTFLRTARSVLTEQTGAVEFWVRPNWNGNDGQVNYFMEHSSDTVAMNRSGSLLLLSVNASNSTILTSNITSWQAGEWHHVAFSWQQRRNLSLFIDGVRVNSTIAPSLTSSGGSLFFFIGSNSSTSGGLLLNGTLDELRFSNAPRESIDYLNSTNYTLTLSDYADNTYYWRARAVQYVNRSLDGERSDSTWSSRSVVLDSHLPSLSATEDPIKQLSENSTALNLTSSEPLYCEYRTTGTSFAPMSLTGGVTQGTLVNLTQFRNFTYFVNCNDTVNNFVNTTISFYVFNLSAGTVLVNSTNKTFTAGQNQTVNISFLAAGDFIAAMLTTNNNVSGKLHGIKHNHDRNPENSSEGLPTHVVAFWTLVMDDTLAANLTGNATLRLDYTSANEEDIPSTVTTYTLYYFDPVSFHWNARSESIFHARGFVNFSTNYFGTYALGGEAGASAAAAARRAAAAAGRAAGPRAMINVETGALEYTFTNVDAGVENFIDLFDEGLDLISIGFTSAVDLENVIIIVSQEETEEDAYASFTIDALLMTSDELESMYIEYVVSKAWLDDYGYSLDELYFVDEDGNEYEMVSTGEDDDYYYFESDVNRFGTFTIAVSTLAAVEEEAVEEVTEEEGAAAEEAPPAFVSATLLYVFLASVLAGVLVFCVWIFGLGTVFTFKKKYGIPKEALEETKADVGQLKYYIYRNLDKPGLDQEIIEKGWDAEQVVRLISSVKKLGNGKLAAYVYSRVSLGDNEETIVKDLSKVGWKEKDIRAEIQRFKTI